MTMKSEKPAEGIAAETEPVEGAAGVSPSSSVAPSLVFTVSELAKRHGQIQGAMAGENPMSAAHQSAAVLNAWAKTAHEQGEEVKLSDADYLAAIEAAKLGASYAPAMKGA
jgi:hypothetical protein